MRQLSTEEATSLLLSSAAISERYRGLPEIADFELRGTLRKTAGFFRFGEGVIGYGQAAIQTQSRADLELPDALEQIQMSDGALLLPFDTDQIVDNLRFERYVGPPESQRWMEQSWVKDVYYRFRGLLPTSIRRHLQKIYLSGWESLSLPSWPVDRSVDIFCERLLILAMRASKKDRVPFIWFWPSGYGAAAIVTHDIETRLGRDRIGQLLDIDDSFGIKASIQVVPEKRYPVSSSYLQMLRDRGAEVNVHGLDHDGNLFRNREEFLERARKINEYAELFGARGFRAPSMYRNADWFQDLNFSYDMSVPSVARLEPQQGGCCTVMPYFLPGGMTELPLTMTQDYALFNILNDYSTALWKKQIGIILKGHGLISAVVHPDYLISQRAQSVYKELLAEISKLHSNREVWAALPGEVDQWWRQRSEMRLVPAGTEWRIEGCGSDRAQLAYACLDGDHLVYEY